MADTSPAASAEFRHSLVLRAWEAINSERELDGVLRAVAEVITPVVPFTGVAIITFETGEGLLFALHIVGMDRIDVAPLRHLGNANVPAEFMRMKPERPYDNWALLDRARRNQPLICNDLMAEPAWYEHEYKLAAGGIRAYASMPMIMGDEIIGSAVFTRKVAEPFTPDQITVLRDVSRAISVAVANALAYEEIRRLRDELKAENIALREQLGQAPWFEDIVGASGVLHDVLDTVEQVASTDATVLITGETGTGKELIARALHRRSPRAAGPLVKVNCAAIPGTLLGSELFGHERGAFTGAVERRKGRFEQAHRGTLFLDEIGELSSEMQVLLLRVLQEREFERLGGSQSIQVDVRIIAATNRDLTEDVQAGRFRSDLYYRLNVFPIRVPPLRERRDDIPALVAHFAAKYGERFGRQIGRIEQKTLRMLENHDWPGNVRELENVIERAVIVSRDGVLRVDEDVLTAFGSRDQFMPKPLALPSSRDVACGAYPDSREKQAICNALAESGGKISGPNGAAARLGMAASTLEFRIRKLGIDKFKYRRSATA